MLKEMSNILELMTLILELYTVLAAFSNISRIKILSKVK